MYLRHGHNHVKGFFSDIFAGGEDGFWVKGAG
jgi:hypothetical protein